MVVAREIFLKQRAQASNQASAQQLNDAWNELRSPARRARALVVRMGRQPIQDGTVPVPMPLLELHIRLREALAEAGDTDELNALRSEVETVVTQAGSEFAAAYSQGRDDAAEAAFYALQFAEKLRADLGRREDELSGI